MMTSGQILDTIGKYLTKEQIEKIESQAISTPTIPEFKLSGEMKYYNDHEDHLMGAILSGEEASYETPVHTNILVQHVE